MTTLDVSGRASPTTDVLLAERGVWGSFIGGSFVVGEADTFDVLETSTGRVLARVANASVDTVDLAVADSRRAYERVWRDLSARERGGLMR
jgi:acyl-CoA reductase-like NAD-dependent aldehyde dehydrogenase